MPSLINPKILCPENLLRYIKMLFNKTIKTSSSKNTLADILIILGLLGLVYVYYPLVKVYYFPSTLYHSAIRTGDYIEIPKISAFAPLVLDVNPWDPQDYLPSLQKGVIEARDFNQPGQSGTTYLLAHSSDLPWRITSYNTAFLRLGQLRAGDLIHIHQANKDYTYRVIDQKTVWPNQVASLIVDSGKIQLIVQTCTPIGTDWQRLLVYAQIIPEATLKN